METQTDAGWSWMVMIAVMITSFMENGVYKSFGIFFVEYIKRFDSSASVTSLISGAFFGVYSVSALLIMMVGLKYISSRQSVAIGGLCMSAGFLLSAFADTIGYLILAQGVLTGMGSAFIAGPSLVILGRYFDKRRGLANGVALSFGSIGGLVVPPLFHYMVEQYNLTGALLITSGLLLHIIVGAFLMRPIRSGKILEDEDKSKCDANTKTVVYNECVENDSKDLKDDTQLYDPLIKHIYNQNQNFKELKESSAKQTTNSNISKSCSALDEHDVGAKRHFQTKKTSSFFCSFEKLSASSILLNGSISNMAAIASNSADVNNKPGHSSTDRYNQSHENKIKAFFKSFWEDLTILKNPLYIVLLLTFCIGGIGLATVHVFIPPFAKEMGVNNDEIALLTIIIGGTDFLGRIICALISDCKYIQKYQLIMVALFIVGISMQLAPFYNGFPAFIVLSVIFGTFGGIMITFYATVLIDFIGFDGFETGLGLMTSSQGIVVAAFTPFEGFLKDITGTYRTTFHFLGTCAIAAGSLLLIVPFIKRLKRNQGTLHSEEDQEHL